MFKKIKRLMLSIAKLLIPKKVFEGLKNKSYQKQNDNFLKKLTHDIIEFHEETNDPEIIAILQFLKEQPISVFPYEYIYKYQKDAIEVLTDSTNNLKYVMHEGKKLYFKRSMTESGIKGLYRGLLIDQDPKSPHLYLTTAFNLTNNDVIADIGAAEGNFSLSNIEKVKKVYLFEMDPEWIEALEATFKPWEDKVEIINSFVTNYDSDRTLNINTFYQKHSGISFFKVDIEGEEQNFLNSCKDIFKTNSNLKIAICTYHKLQDEEDFTSQLLELGFEVQHSEGYMIYYYDPNLKPPYLRRGLLRAQKTLI